MNIQIIIKCDKKNAYRKKIIPDNLLEITSPKEKNNHQF